MVFPNGISIIPSDTDPNACPMCGGKGYVLKNTDGVLTAKECDCEIKRRTMKRIEQSGISSLIKNYTFENYQTNEEWQYNAKAKAIDYVAHGNKQWFFIAGTPGSGKTHLCTAIVGMLIQGNKYVRYMLWREEAPRLKAQINDREAYDSEMSKLKKCDVLYIDDFLKGSVSDGDINLAFELLNDRYNTGKVTIISGEKDISQILSIDEAIGSRIYERSKGYCIKTPPKSNWRLKV